ncbi:Glucose repression protein GAL83 [Tuber indicum]|nr:Glucose repression protein GAL83 [Tuber indicum]
MGNNPSRASAQPQQQQHHHHQHHHLNQQHSTPTSPPIANVPARAASTSSSRTTINRRNSLQPAPSKHTSASTSVPPEDPLPRNEPASAIEARYIPQGRRESIAEAISSVPWTIIHTTSRPTPGFDDEDALTSPTLRKLQTENSAPTAAGEDLPSRVGTPLSAGPHADPLTKRGSMGSTTTVDDEEVDVADTRTIPTLVQWLQGGHKVYVTGTFSNWRKRFKLNRSPDDETLSAVVPLPPGTHHLKFFVDGEMRTSDNLPTAVDDTGILVNYLEVNADDMPPLDRQHSPPSPSGSTHHPHASANLLSNLSKKKKRYTKEIPAYLRDFDDGGEDGHRIGNEDGDIPAPPSLPMMLQKVILNTSSAMKDDASVLGIPNHVVLNHLATSSIKNQVLAVSATTRYRKKAFPPSLSSAKFFSSLLFS